jgi:hypothetical protein
MKYFATYLCPLRPDAVYKGYDDKKVVEIIMPDNHMKQECYIEDDYRFLEISKSTFYYWRKRWINN